jgi:hypothetical protein
MTLQSLVEAKTGELSSAIKAQADSGHGSRPSEAIRQLTQEARNLKADLLRQVRLLQHVHGITEAQIRAIERARDSERLPCHDERYWRSQIEDTPPMQYLDDIAEAGLDQLLRTVDPEWLRTESRRPYRLGPNFLSQPLHLVNGIRVGVNLDSRRPQRFAQMLLVCEDYVANRLDLDFFSAAMFVAEIAILGNSLTEIKQLGHEAERKLTQPSGRIKLAG